MYLNRVNSSSVMSAESKVSLIRKYSFVLSLRNHDDTHSEYLNFLSVS